MFGKKDSIDFNVSGDLNTIIGKGSSFEGTFVVHSTIRIDGKIKGKITTSESLVVGKEGEIDGEVKVRNAIIGGKVKGKLNASGKVVLEAKSQFNGELKTAKLVIDEGAIFEGSCSMREEKVTDSNKELPKTIPKITEPEGETKEMKIAK